MSRRWVPLRKTKQNKVIRCNGVKKNGKSCKQIVAKKGDYCKYHSSQKNAQKKVFAPSAIELDMNQRIAMPRPRLQEETP